MKTKYPMKQVPASLLLPFLMVAALLSMPLTSEAQSSSGSDLHKQLAARWAAQDWPAAESLARQLAEQSGRTAELWRRWVGEEAGKHIAARRYEQAVALVEQAVRVAAGSVPAEARRGTLTDLGDALRAAGQPALALPVHEQVRREWQAALGGGHAATWDSMNNLAATLNALGQHEAARALAQSVQAAYESAATADGRLFTRLTETDVDALPDDEFDRYQKGKTAAKFAALVLATATFVQEKSEVKKLDETLAKERADIKKLDETLAKERAEIKQLDETIAQNDARIKQLKDELAATKLELGLKASQSIRPLLAEYKAGRKPVISADLKDVQIKIANGDLPPQHMQALARELVAFF